MNILKLAAMVLTGCLTLPAFPSPSDEDVARIPAMPEWKLVHRVEPEYPVLARQRHIEGSVRFTAMIGEDGRVQRLWLVSGHPLLVRAAREALQQWRYRVTMVNGRPVRVLTRIEVQFALDRAVDRAMTRITWLGRSTMS